MSDPLITAQIQANLAIKSQGRLNMALAKNDQAAVDAAYADYFTAIEQLTEAAQHDPSSSGSGSPGPGP